VRKREDIIVGLAVNIMKKKKKKKERTPTSAIDRAVGVGRGAGDPTKEACVEGPECLPHAGALVGPAGHFGENFTARHRQRRLIYYR
jgi:hypothetical protein